MECTVQNIKVYYEIHGAGTPILMIHGWSPDHRLMKGCMEPIFQTLDQPWQRIYFDLPGMGKTKGEPWITSSDQVLDLVLGLIDAVIPNQHFLVAGESYGGYLARGIIHKRPLLVDGLLLICPSVVQDQIKRQRPLFQVLEKDELLLNSLSEEERSNFTYEGLNTSQTKRVWDRFQAEILSGLKVADWPFLETLGQQMSFSFNVDALEQPYSKPTLMLAGRQDSMVGYRDLWEIIESYPRASFVLLDKAGHNLQIEQDLLFTATVKEWLNRVAAELS